MSEAVVTGGKRKRSSPFNFMIPQVLTFTFLFLTSIVAIYKDGPEFEIRAFDSDGRQRPDWEATFRRRPLRATRMKPADASEYDWPALAARSARLLDNRAPHAVAAIVVRG